MTQLKSPAADVPPAQALTADEKNQMMVEFEKYAAKEGADTFAQYGELVAEMEKLV